jgi:hypothetical protein
VLGTSGGCLLASADISLALVAVVVVFGCYYYFYVLLLLLFALLLVLDMFSRGFASVLLSLLVFTAGSSFFF